MHADPIARTRAHLAAAGAADRLPVDPAPGIALDIEWETITAPDGRPVRYDAVVDRGNLHDWQHELWWPDESSGALLRALHAVDQRALAAL